MMRNIRGYVEDGWDTKDVIYILTGEDAQYVARKDILRELTQPELEVVYSNLPKEIDWRNVNEHNGSIQTGWEGGTGS